MAERKKRGSQNLENNVRTGIPGFDEILNGGFAKNELYLLQGDPGTGKTIFSMQFLKTGIEAGERCLFITFSQRVKSLREAAESLGFSLEGIHIYDLSQQKSLQQLSSEQVIFESAEIEMEELMQELLELLERVAPDRVVFDSISYLRMLANDSARYRRQLLLLRNFFSRHNATVLLTDDQEQLPIRSELQALVHGVILLNHESTQYGSERRFLNIQKFRGRNYLGGLHDFRIGPGGIRVFKRLQGKHAAEKGTWETISSGIVQIDSLLHGGLSEGTTCLFAGPAGAGKSSLAAHFLDAAAMRGEKTAAFLFDELPGTFIHRSENLGMKIGEHIKNNLLNARLVSPGEYSTGEFAHEVLSSVKDFGARIVLIDTLSGYINAMPDVPFLVTQIHDLIAALNQLGVLTIIVVAQHGYVGTRLEDPLDVSYLADAVILFRNFEAGGRIRRAVSVFKKRYGDHERYIRELDSTKDGIRIGEPLSGFSGVLSGNPVFSGRNEELIDKGEHRE